ncbi:MAG: helix-turn-helix transcriptional regulator [Clostridiales bacterium]|uniref:helix-turn-helix domain-containing protein n=1 Tax=Enterocloster sp. TaxID=2719315 RepID=UPI0017487111|nr:helix-turn-helix transcriptional regulator [Clostridiales bacterium]
MMSYELERINELCIERGWSHYRLALEMDTSPNNIGNMFRRTTIPSIPTLRRICEVMGISMAQFYSTDGTQVTLSPKQQRILELYNNLDQIGKGKLEAYLEGLSGQHT